MLLLTIVAAFAFGVAAGYWVICGFLNFFNPGPDAQQARVGPGLGAEQRRLAFNSSHTATRPADSSSLLLQGYGSC